MSARHTGSQTVTHLDFCRFTGIADDLGNWSTWDVDGGPVLLCETHLEPADGDVYDTGVGVCAPTAEYIRSHGDWIDGDVVDPARCRCGRPANSCTGRADVAAILAHVAYQRAHFGLWDVRLIEDESKDMAPWLVRAYGSSADEAILNARTDLAGRVGADAADRLQATAERQNAMTTS